MTDEQITDTLIQLAECLDWEKVKQGVGIEKAHIATLSLIDYINHLKIRQEELATCNIRILEREASQIRKNTAKDILQIVREVQRGENGMKYRNPDCVIASRIKEKYGIEE